MKKSVTFGEDDAEALRASAPILEPHIEEILDVWYGFVGSQPHLVRHFCDPTTGAPLEGYLNAVRRRFGQWIRDTAAANYDQAWLDYQFEIGRRHHSSGKNTTDGVEASPLIPLRDLILLTYPITATLKPFLGRTGAPPEEIERMQQAWLKSVLLQVTLWSHPYVRGGEF
ncbi:MAG: protogloblin ApPgb [Planctomycetota bacterium]|nr:MAG: protogloblin ApPgb [Planctomycetota bacterium]